MAERHGSEVEWGLFCFSPCDVIGVIVWCLVHPLTVACSKCLLAWTRKSHCKSLRFLFIGRRQRASKFKLEWLPCEHETSIPSQEARRVNFNAVPPHVHTHTPTKLIRLSFEKLASLHFLPPVKTIKILYSLIC